MKKKKKARGGETASWGQEARRRPSRKEGQRLGRTAVTTCNRRKKERRTISGEQGGIDTQQQRKKREINSGKGTGISKDEK